MKSSLLLSLLLVNLFLFGMMAPSVWAWPEDVQSLSFGISYMTLRKSFFDLPTTWKSTMPVFFSCYDMQWGRLGMKISFRYGRSSSISVNDLPKEGRNFYTLKALDLDLVWFNAPAKTERKLLYGYGVCFDFFELMQRISLCPEKYNQQEDKYKGIGPLFSCIWKIREKRLLTGLDLSLPFTLPYASQGISRTDGSYSSKAYLWWIKLRTNLFIQHRLSKGYSIGLVIQRDVWVYGRNPYKNVDYFEFKSGGAILLNSLNLKLSRQF